MKAKGVIMIIIDGGADRPLAIFGNRTPIEAAETPMLDKLTKNGICKLVEFLKYHPDFPDLPGPTSDQAHLMLLSQTQKYSNRGEFMAWAVGLNPHPGDICFRAYVKARIAKRVIRFSPTLNRNEARAVEEKISKFKDERIKFVKLKFNPYTDHPRWAAFLIRPQIPLSDNISVVEHLPKLEYFSHLEEVYKYIASRETPHNTKNRELDSNISEILAQIYPRDNSISSINTAKILKKFTEFTYNLFLKEPLYVSTFKMPIGIIQATESAYAIGNFEQFNEKFYPLKIKSAAFVEKMEVLGVTRALKFDYTVYTKEMFDEEKHIQSIIKSGYNFILIQFKQTDNLSHDNNPEGKKQYIEKIDKFIYRLYKLFPDYIYVVLPDHTTPTGLYFRIHTREPVPIIISGPNVPRDKVEKYGERTCKSGSPNLIRATQILTILKKYLLEKEAS